MVTNNTLNTEKPIGVSDGGVGAATLLDHGVLIGSGSAAVTALTVGLTGEVLVGSSAADPEFSSTPTVTSLTATTGNITTLDTNVAAAGLTIAGTTIEADGTDADIRLTLTPKGSSSIFSLMEHNESYSATTANTPLLELYNRITSTSVCGVISLIGQTSTNGNHNTELLSCGSSGFAGSFRIKQRTGSTTYAENLVIQSTGEVTMPKQSAFQGFASSTATNVTGDGTAYDIVFGGEAFDQNSDYAAATRVLGLDSNHVSGSVVLVTTAMSYTLCTINPYNSSVSGATTFGGSALCNMTAADTAYLTLEVGGGTKIVDIQASDTVKHAYFTGNLVC